MSHLDFFISSRNSVRSNFTASHSATRVMVSLPLNHDITIILPPFCIPYLPLMPPLHKLQHEHIVEEKESRSHRGARSSHNNRNFGGDRVLTWHEHVSKRLSGANGETIAYHPAPSKCSQS